MVTFPNILSYLRLALAPVLLVLAWYDYPTAFIYVLVVAFILDAIDGPIARRLQQVSDLGPKIDSWADFSIYMTFAIGAWWLWPGIIKREIIFLLFLLASILLPVLAGLIKFKKIISYHTWSVKFAAVCMAPSAILLFLIDIAWPFRVASIICLLAGLEEIIITIILDKPYSDVRTLLHVLKTKNKKEI